nr:molybdenum ABC transporter ATP-binding protein [Parahaliea mediterranea]
MALNLDCRGADDFRLRLDESLPLSGVTAIYGASGSGKTTLLECIAGLRRGDAGSRIHFAGEAWQDGARHLPPWQRRVGYVFQDARLFPHLDVAGNLDFGRRRRGGHEGLEPERVSRWLGLDTLLHRRPDTLSAGQQQRVAIARALLSAPRLMLLDEPLANLDGASRQQCLDSLRRVIAATGIPMIYVSHDIEEVSQFADRMLVLEAGRVRDRGPMLELSSRIDTRLAHEEQAAAILRANVVGHDEAFGLSELAVDGGRLWVNRLPGEAGAARRIRVPARDVSVCRSRPEDSSILNILPVTVAEIEATGETRVLLRLALGEQYLLARITRKSAAALELAVGDTIYAQIKSAALLSDIA